MKKILIKTLIMIVSALLLFYIMLPAINIHDIRFYTYIIFLLIELLVLLLPNGIEDMKRNGFRYALKNSAASVIVKVILGIMGLAFAYALITSIIYSPFFMSKTYASRINVETVEFSEVPAYNFNTTAIIDRDSASRLGDKVMGEMTDLVSQFQVSSEYSQIDYQSGTYRVTPLAYDGIIKYFKNAKEGIPGYILVNTTTGEASLTRLDDKMRYVPSAYFFENFYRKLRINHPFEIFGNPTFEIDEEGNPFYVCTTYTYKGISNLKKVTGVVLFNPIDGTSEKYNIEDVPKWVDRIYPESLVNTELNNYGKYQKGFLNSFIGQEGVIQTSEGYNYISKNGDIWLYTGMTSVVADESNIGFMLVNLRTHEAEYIVSSGADEYSVMASAEGEVSDYGYLATFPVLINIKDEPFYLLSLKDSAGLIKMYAMVDSRDYQQVYTVRADKDSKTAIEQLILLATGTKVVDTDVEYQETTIQINDIKQAVIDGNTYLYLNTNDGIYTIKITTENASKALYLKTSDKINIKYYLEGNNKYIESIN